MSRAVAEALDEADPEAVIHAAALSSAEAVRSRSGARPGGQRRGHPAAGRLGGGPRPTAGVHLDRPGLRRLDGPGIARTTRPGRSWRTAGPSTRPSRTCWRPPRPGRPAQPAVRPDAIRPPRLLRPGDRRPAPRRAASVLRGRIPHAARLPHRRRHPRSGSSSPRRSGSCTSAGRERLSRFELMRRAAVASGIDPDLVRPGARPTPPCPNPGPPMSRSTPPGWRALSLPSSGPRSRRPGAPAPGPSVRTRDARDLDIDSPDESDPRSTPAHRIRGDRLPSHHR